MSPGDSLIGKKLGAYRIESLLGSGGMGDVYRGTHELLGRPVAIKTLKPEVAADASLLKRFFDEARVVNTIRHENIVEVTDLVSEPGGNSYMVMELLEGCTLGDAIRAAHRLVPERAVRIAVQIASAIFAAHEKGVIHRDLKPDNVFLIRRAGTSDYVKILDFGIARLRPEQGGIGATKTGAVIGTPAYMSPEQAEGKHVESSTDIYALGVILFQMLTGRLPFEGPSLPRVMFGHIALEPPSVHDLSPDVPLALARVIARTLAKKPAERPASMAELRTSLCQAVGLELPEAASPASMWSGPTMDATDQLRAGISASKAASEPGPDRGSSRDIASNDSRDIANNDSRDIANNDSRDIANNDSRDIANNDSGDIANNDSRDIFNTALARPRARSTPAGSSEELGLQATQSADIDDSGVHSTPVPQPSSIRQLRPRIATPRAMPAHHPAAPKKRPLLWITALVAAAGGAVLSFLLIRSPASAGDSAAADPADASFAAHKNQTAPANDPAELRRRLDRIVIKHHEPGAPPACQTRDADLLARLVRAAQTLIKGGPGMARPQDTEAVRVLSEPVPDQAEYWYWLAKARLYSGANHESIVDATERAIERCKTYAAAYNAAGTAQFRAKDAAAAEALYRKALALDSEFITARYNLGLVQLERGDVAGGIATLTQVITHDAGNVDALVARGQAYLMANNPAAAVRDLESATRTAPHNATAYWLLGNALAALNQHDDARQAMCTAGRLGHTKAAGQCKE